MGIPLRWWAWAWLAVATVGGFFGMAAAYRDPALLRIDAFADIYSAAGFSDRLMITALLVTPFLIALGAAAVILVRRGSDRAASLFAIGLVALYYFVSGASVGLTGQISDLLASASLVLMVLFLATFPSATFRPRWGIAAPLMAGVLVAVRPGLASGVRASLGRQPLDPIDWALALVGFGAIMCVAAMSQVVRHRRMSSTIERYQTRWVLAALVLMVTPPLAVLALLAADVTTDSPVVGYLVLASALGSFALPAAVSVATFRYNLYEIDRIISRTLTYGIVAVVVSGVYAGTVVLLPAILGSGGPAFVAGATLAAAAVFEPVRRRVQDVVDRRFNRTSYDAERELGALTAGLAATTQVSEIRSEVAGVLGRTIEPANLSWWVSGVAGRRLGR
jgi:hypothetical protein